LLCLKHPWALRRRRRRMQITCLRGGGGIHNLSDYLLPHKRKAHDYLCGWVTQDVMNCVREEGIWKYHIITLCLCFFGGQQEVGVEELLWYLLGIGPDVQRGCCCCCHCSWGTRPAVFLDQNKKERTPLLLWMVELVCTSYREVRVSEWVGNISSDYVS
jgi:hypothetical protein